MCTLNIGGASVLGISFPVALSYVLERTSLDSLKHFGLTY